MLKIDDLFAFKIGQIVKVTVVSTVTTGIIFHRTLHDNGNTTECRYRVNWDGDESNYVESWETSLLNLNK